MGHSLCCCRVDVWSEVVKGGVNYLVGQVPGGVPDCSSGIMDDGSLICFCS